MNCPICGGPIDCSDVEKDEWRCRNGGYDCHGRRFTGDFLASFLPRESPMESAAKVFAKALADYNRKRGVEHDPEAR